MKAKGIGVQLAESSETGKFRVYVTVAKDDWLDLHFVLTADEAETMAAELCEVARAARGRQIIIPEGVYKGGGSA